MNRHVITMVMGPLLLIGSTSVSAWAIDGPPDRGRPMGPPPEAIEACKDKTEGTQVNLATPWGEHMTATCKAVDGQLAAVPEGGPQDRGRPMGPPPGRFRN